MRAIVTEAESFIGQYLVRHLVKQHYSVVSLNAGKDLRQTNPNIINEHIDFLEPLSIVNILKKYTPDIIFNLPVQSSVGYTWENPAAAVDANINSMLNLLDAIRQLCYKPTIIMVGSAEEYGSVSYDRMPIKETEPPKPENVFAASKVCQAMIAQIYYKAYDMQIIVARVFNEIGPMQSEKFVVSDFSKQVALIEKGVQESVIYAGNINIQRDFTDIRDMVKALEALAKKGAPGEVYNVGTGRAVKLSNIIKILENLTPIQFKLEAQEERIRPMDISKLEADVSKIYRDTGWKSEIKIEETIEDMLKIWRKQVQ